MLIIRKYRKLPWFDFLECIDAALEKNPMVAVYFELLDELRMRKIESISEGASFKMQAPTQKLWQSFSGRLATEANFADPNELKEFKSLVASMTGKLHE